MVAAGELSAVELVGHSLKRIEALNPRLNAFVAVDSERALARAAEIDAKVARGEEVGPLAGVPVGVKDLEDAAGFVTSHGSAAMCNSDAATADSPLVSRLVRAGCVVVGKTNTPELGWAAETINPLYGATFNPWDTSRSPGGSSGGSAAAIASGMVPLATGSDGGGSIRIPASVCGLSGMKPSLGRIPSAGDSPPDWPLLSTSGVMACRIPDTVAALRCAIGPDPRYLDSLPMPEVPFLSSLSDPHVPVKVAWSPDLGYAPVDAEVLSVCESALKTLESLGAEVVEAKSVFTEDPVPAWLTLTSTYNRRTLEDRLGPGPWVGLDPALATMVEWAGTFSGVEIVRALDACHRMNLRLVELFRKVRLLVTPTCAAVAPLSGSPGLINGIPDVDWVRFTYPFNMTRSPAATVCAGFTSERMPVGLQLVGPQHGDQVVLRAAAALEAALGIEELPPLE
jgi:aspartyl-tRNA(Asn)/glutamyl-tRNA(Gln) amidotransferase subunit A